MHEQALVKSLVRRCIGLAAEHHAERVSRVTVRLGALSHSDPETLRAYFSREARGTIVDGAILDVLATDELLEIALDSIEMEHAGEDGTAG
jgi:hydrogenase nickel incorporation protein HypA/HybF